MRNGDNSAAAARLAYDEVKRRIIELEWPPGTKLSEARLVEELGLGRSPIRTAFSRLQSEGWIEVTPQSGSYVRSLTEKEIAEIIETRLLIEIHVTRLAARNIDAERLRKLRVAFRRFAPRGKVPDAELFDAFNELDSMFHANVYEAGGNRVMTGILANLLDKVRWIKMSFPSTPKRIRQSFAEIERVLAALEARDANGAARAMRDHIGNAADFAANFRKEASRRAAAAD